MTIPDVIISVSGGIVQDVQGAAIYNTTAPNQNGWRARNPFLLAPGKFLNIGPSGMVTGGQGTVVYGVQWSEITAR